MNTVYLLVAVLIVFVIYLLCKQSEGAKVIFTTLLIIVLGVGTFYSGIEINKYYSATGGIIGQISGIFNTNEIEVGDNLEIKLNNIELTKVDEESYVARFEETDEDKIIHLAEGKNYNVYVNDIPCLNLETSMPNVISANYTYNFYSENQELILSDTINFKFAFNDKSTVVLVTTKGGAEAVKYWNYYFNKNDVVITLKEIENQEDFESNFSDLNLGENESLVTYYFDEDLAGFQVVATGAKLNPIEIEMPEGIQFNGWKVNDEIVDTSSYIVNENTSFHADYIELVHLELRAGTSQSYTVLDSGYYAQGTTLLDCLGYTLPDTAMTNLGIEIYDGNMSMDWEFDSKVEDIAGGVLYISSLTMQASPRTFFNSGFDTETRRYQITDLGLSESVDLSYVTGCYVSEIEIENINTQSNISLVQKDFGQYSPTSYFYSGDKIWTTKDGGTEEKDFSLTYQLDSNLNLIIEVSENLLGDRGSVVVNSYRFSLVNLIIEFSPNVFYLV